MRFDINVGEKLYRVDLEKPSEPQVGGWLCRVDGGELKLDAKPVDADTISIVIGGRSTEARRLNGVEGQWIFIAGRQYKVALQDARSLKSRRRVAGMNAGPLRLTAAMPGRIVRLLAKVGDNLKSGSGIVVVEAMKMQNELRSPKDATLKELLVREGMNVNAGDPVAVLE
jgi:biotin carboxyl carrier protein